MPTICQFFGITIRMYFDDHGPAHFHAYYGGEEAVIGIEGLEILEGWIPGRALGLIVEWALDHRSELRDNWRRAMRHEPLSRIAPLK